MAATTSGRRLAGGVVVHVDRRASCRSLASPPRTSRSSLTNSRSLALHELAQGGLRWPRRRSNVPLQGDHHPLLPSMSMSSMSPPSCLEGRAHLALQGLLDELHLLDVGQGLFLAPASGGVISTSWGAGSMVHMSVQDGLDLVNALAAAAAGLGVVGDLLHGVQVVGAWPRFSISWSVTPKHWQTTSTLGLGQGLQAAVVADGRLAGPPRP